VNYAKHLNRHELVLAVWAAEFTRSLGSVPVMENPQTASFPTTAPILRLLAQRAASSADRMVEALRLLIDVEFRLASYDELDDCYLTWDKFIACCQGGALTDAHGHGELATEDHHVSNVRIVPSEALSESYVRPDWATHVRWYDR
jgi:hypothetical protein